MRLTYKYRIYPTAVQTNLLNEHLSICCELYNAALEERNKAYNNDWRYDRGRMIHTKISYYDQQKQLPGLKQIRSEIANIDSQTLQNVLGRVDKSYQAFYRRCDKGEKPGYPRFQSSRRYDSMTYRINAVGNIRNGRVRISKIGFIKIKLSRPLEGKIRQLTVKREAGKWFACFSCIVELKPLLFSTENVGIDVGLTHFAALNNGSTIENPRWYRRGQAKLRRCQRKVARRKKSSHRRRKAIQLLQRAHMYVRNQRSDFHHKESRKIVNKYGFIVVEDLKIKEMVQSKFAKSISDAGWSSFIAKLSYKAESAGRTFLKIDPRGTSQTCICGANVPKQIWDRWHTCSECGLSQSRDHVSAQVILGRGLRLQSVT